MGTLKKLALLALLGAALGASVSACSSTDPQAGDGYLGRPAERFEGYGGYNGGP